MPSPSVSSSTTPSSTSTPTPTSTTTQPTPTSASSAPAISTTSAVSSPPAVTSTAAVSSITATNSAPAASSSPATGSSSHFSAGTLAGAIVGSVLGAALITFVVTYLLVRRKMQRKAVPRRRLGDERSEPKSTPSKRQTAAAAGPTSNSDNEAYRWQAYLPQSVDDHTVRNAVKTFFDQIELHVDNYYRKGEVSLNDTARQGLAQLDTGELPGPIETLIVDPRLSLSVIKHCIAGLLIARLSPSAEPVDSLLPSRLSQAPTKLHASTIAPKEKRAVEQAYSQWRLLNAYLFPRSEEGPVYVQGADKATDDISRRLSAAFSPWRRTSEDASAWQQHQQSLIANASSVGLLLMTQPSAYEFRWRPADENAGAIATSPGFLKVADESGRPLGRPQVLVSPAIVRM